jgi:hypothetical protein
MTSTSGILSAGEKKCRPMKRSGCRSLRQQAMGRGIAGQHAARRQHGVQLAGHFGLDGTVFEHGFDHHIGIAQQLVIGAGRRQFSRLAALVHRLASTFSE